MTTIITKNIPNKPRSKNYGIGSKINFSGGGVIINPGGTQVTPGLPYEVDEFGNYLIKGNTIFKGNGFEWKTKDNISLLSLNEEGLKIQGKTVLCKEDIDKWFYTDSEGNLHCKVNFIGDGHIASISDGDIEIPDVGSNGSQVEVFDNYQEIINAKGLNNKIYIDREKKDSYIWNTLTSEYLKINDNDNIEEFESLSELLQSEGIKNKIYIDKYNSSIYSYDVKTNQFYSITGGVITYPKLYLEAKTGKLILHVNTDKNDNIFEIINGHLILKQ